LREHEGLRVVTNNIDVALTLSEAPNVEVHMTGGMLRHNDRDVVGSDALRFFEKFYASYAVIGAGALDPTKGILDFSYSEAQTTTTLIENSRLQFLAADVSKWTRDASVRVVPFNRISSLFTDPPTRAYPRFVELGAQVGEELGVDYDVGRRLFGMFHALGLTGLSVSVHQPSFSTGERKRLWEYTFLEAAPGAIAAGVGTAEEVGELAAELAAIGEEDSTLVVQPSLLAVSGVVPDTPV
jgi:hypothetical protein